MTAGKVQHTSRPIPPDVRVILDQLKPGQMVVVLAKYTAKQKSAQGYELVATGDW